MQELIDLALDSAQRAGAGYADIRLVDACICHHMATAMTRDQHMWHGTHDGGRFRQH